MVRHAPEAARLPVWGDGRRVKVGLLGGSFDPAHDGHRKLAEFALKHLQLDQIWLLVTPANPFKKNQHSESFSARLRSARRISDGRRVVATDIEARLGTSCTAETLKHLIVRFPHISFVWVMGADSFASLPRWNHWRDIVRRVSLAVIPRPSNTNLALHGRTAQVLRRFRVQARSAFILTHSKPPGWAFFLAPHSAISSTALRHSASRNGTLDTYYQLEQDNIVTNPTSRPKRAARPMSARTIKAQTSAECDGSKAVTPKTIRKKDIVCGPEKKSRAKTPAPADQVERLMTIIRESLIADKAEDIIVIDLVGRASFADKMVIATGLADRQIAAMATHVEEKLKEFGIKRVLIEGDNGSDWVLLDAGDIVVHFFKPESRQHYALERMWAPELDDDADV